MIEAALRHCGRIDVVVNNAGVIQVGPVASMTIEDFKTAMDTMFWGTVYTTLAALPRSQHAAEARIVNITSVGAKVCVPHLVPYSARAAGCGAKQQRNHPFSRVRRP